MGLSKDEEIFLQAVYDLSLANGGAALVSEAEAKAGINHALAVPIIDKLLDAGYLSAAGLGALTITKDGAAALPKSETPAPLERGPHLPPDAGPDQI